MSCYRLKSPRVLRICAIASALCLPGLVAAQATTTTSSFSVTMTITASCTIASAGTLAFPSTGVLTSPVTATSAIVVQCTNSTPYNIGLNAGATTGGTTTTRLMAAGATTIQYQMFTNTGHTTNWGNTVGTDTVAATGNGANQSYTVYGQVPAQTSVAPGSYSDTVTVTVTY